MNLLNHMKKINIKKLNLICNEFLICLIKIRMLDLEDYNYFIECNLDIQYLKVAQFLNSISLTVHFDYTDNIQKFKNYLVKKYNYIKINIIRCTFYFDMKPNKYIHLPKKIVRLDLMNYKNIINLNNLPEQLKVLRLYNYSGTQELSLQ